MSVASVPPASALDAPEVFVRPQTWDTHEAAGDWIPLASAPVRARAVACVARGTVEGLDDSRDRAVFATPWSAPLSVDVRSDFRRRTGTVSAPRAKRPRFTFVAEWPEYAGGGTGTVQVWRVTGCKGSRYKLRKVASPRGRFDARRSDPKAFAHCPGHRP
jgi:hypothetical protein